jgi:hypothetical protein
LIIICLIILLYFLYIFLIFGEIIFMIVGSMFKKMLVVIVVVFFSVTVTICSHDPLDNKGFFGRLLASCAQSDIIEHYNNFLERLDLGGVVTESLASPEMQLRAQKAQEAVGVEKKRWVVVRNVPGLVEGLGKDREVLASAVPKAILLDEQHINEKYLSSEAKEYNNDKVISKYGVLNVCLHHEAVHIKYNDFACACLIRLTEVLGSSLLVKLVINPRSALGKGLLYPLAMCYALVAGFCMRRYIGYAERRADIEGYYATQCHQCVSEATARARSKALSNQEKIVMLQGQIAALDHSVPSYQEDYQKFVNDMQLVQADIKDRARYLSVEEAECIAARLRQEDKLCDVHRVDHVVRNPIFRTLILKSNI